MFSRTPTVVTEVFSWFSSVLKDNWQNITSTYIMTASFHIFCKSSFTLSLTFETIWPELLTESLNKERLDV
jgi:hypothetical protein